MIGIVVVRQRRREILSAEHALWRGDRNVDRRLADRDINALVALELRARTRDRVGNFRSHVRKSVLSVRRDDMEILMAHAPGAYASKRLCDDPLVRRIDGHQPARQDDRNGRIFHRLA